MGTRKVRRIMVVDDDTRVLEMLSSLLKKWGHEPIPFDRFEDARAFLEERAPDALVVDVRLGSYNGLQLIHLARQSHPTISLAAVSGFDDPVLRAAAAEAGAAYFLKPMDLLNLQIHLAA